jgi:hypothetical protein
MLSKPHKQCDDNSQCYRQTIVLQEVSNNASDFATFFATFSAFYTTIVSNHSAFIEKAVGTAFIAAQQSIYSTIDNAYVSTK